MRFIVDAQLPAILSLYFRKHGHDTRHTLELRDGNKTRDSEIISIADREQRVVVTKDTDFLDSFLLSGKPNKLLLVETGNISNEALLEIFRQNLSMLMTLFEKHRLVQITADEITARE